MASYEVRLCLKKAQSPDLLKLKVTAKGDGRVCVKDAEVSHTPLSFAAPSDP